jgi:hypothetical protein
MTLKKILNEEEERLYQWLKPPLKKLTRQEFREYLDLPCPVDFKIPKKPTFKKKFEC